MFLTPGSRAGRKRIGPTSGGGAGTPGGVSGNVQFNNAGAFGGFGFYDGSQTVSISGVNGSTAQALRVYNTVDNSSNPTNFERGVFDWTTSGNVLTIGSGAGGTGSARDISIFSGLGLASNFFLEIHFSQSNGALQFNLAGNEIVRVAQSPGLLWVKGNTGGPIVLGSNADVNIARIAAQVVGIASNGVQGTVGRDGWLNYAGQARSSANFTSSNTTLTAITGLSSVPLSANRNYQFEAWLSTTGSSNGGILVGITCTSTTITTIATDGFLLDGNTVRGNQGVISSTGTAVVSVSSGTVGAATASVRLSGMIRVVSSGLFGLTLAQSTANATPQTIVSSGSYLIVQDVP